MAEAAPAAARGLMRRARSATLATTMDDGAPYASLVTVACDTDASPVLLLSDLADHSRNLARDPRAALLFEDASGKANPQTGPRLTVMGRVAKSPEDRHRRRFLARHPGAGLYAGFADFHVYAMTVERGHFVGGFARARWMDAGDLVVDPAAAAAMADREPDVLAHMNRDHAEAIALYATALLGRRPGPWEMVAIDPEGADLRAGHRHARLPFAAPVTDAQSTRDELVRLAAEARARAAAG